MTTKRETCVHGKSIPHAHAGGVCLLPRKTTKTKKARSIWITITTDQGEVFERIDVGAFDLSKPLAVGSVVQDIRFAISQIHARYRAESTAE